MRRYFHLFAVLTLATLSRAQVRVWEGTLTLPTYEEGRPDPNPPFDQFTNNKFNYPYVLRENLTSRRVNHDWRAIFLENEYLKCSVLPDIGGHLYTCIDKISGQSMFYDNTSIKKAAVGYRGAWAAFGIEFNFPVSHNWVSMSPVDFTFHNNADGSASVIVGNVDRVYGMEWTVELILRPKSTLLEERVTLSNRSDVRHRFYWWNNAGVRVSDDSQIVYPMRFAASHGFTEVVRWPVDEDGHDLSVIHNHVHGAGIALYARKPRKLHGRLASGNANRYRALCGIRGSARQENLVLGRGRRGHGLAQSPLRRRQRLRRGSGRPVSQSGDVCVPGTPAEHPLLGILDAGARDWRHLAGQPRGSAQSHAQGSL